ncbi:hypothetical protein KKA23_01545 [Patescibacteria group bacterium]|nr:hypothetical protein [Patescibacteria group bacterium]
MKNNNRKCFLCGFTKPLKRSHIIPAFVIKYLKESSITKRLRSAIAPNKRIQDAEKKFLLCIDCEVSFSKHETWFSKNIFYPYHNRKKVTSNYKNELLKFAVSLSWRTLINHFDKYKELEWVINAEATYRAFLNGRIKNTKPYQHHIFFIDYAYNVNTEIIPEKIQWYLGRATDGTLVHSQNNKIIFIYNKLCKIIIVSFISPPKNRLWKGTKIKKSGRVKTKQLVKDGLFGRFILDRAQEVSDVFKNISERQVNKIEEDFLKNILRVEQSHSLEAFLKQKELDNKTKNNK